MALSDLWENSKEQLRGKHVQQIIAFAGDGNLRDGSVTSIDFRKFLSLIPHENLRMYADQCLKGASTDPVWRCRTSSTRLDTDSDLR